MIINFSITNIILRDIVLPIHENFQKDMNPDNYQKSSITCCGILNIYFRKVMNQIEPPTTIYRSNGDTLFQTWYSVMTQFQDFVWGRTFFCISCMLLHDEFRSYLIKSTPFITRLMFYIFKDVIRLRVVKLF